MHFSIDAYLLKRVNHIPETPVKDSYIIWLKPANEWVTELNIIFGHPGIIVLAITHQSAYWVKNVIAREHYWHGLYQLAIRVTRICPPSHLIIFILLYVTISTRPRLLWPRYPQVSKTCFRVNSVMGHSFISADTFFRQDTLIRSNLQAGQKENELI